LGIFSIDLQPNIGHYGAMSNRIPMSLDDAKPLLEPLVDTLQESFWKAWEWTEEFLSKDDLARVIIDGSNLAGIVSNAFGYFARVPLVNDFKARWFAAGRFHRALLPSNIALRFKKLTPDLHSSNIHTEEQRKVYEQEATLPGAKRIISITFGYTLNSLRTDVTGLYFACPKDFYHNHWVWSVFQSGQQFGLFGSDPLPPDTDIEDVLDVDIKMKKKKRKEGAG
jgi:hypothetical protein